MDRRKLNIMKKLLGTDLRLGPEKVHCLRVLGTGAHSTIYEARSDGGKTYALKRVPRAGRADDRFVIQALTEYQTLRHIDNPNVRAVYHLQKLRRLLSLREVRLLMEYCPGQTLQQAPPKTILSACGIYAQVANALGHVHQAGYVHADMKPSNIVVDESGNVKIIDFGQSCPIGTVKQRIQGTPDFIAPEQVARHPCSIQTDIFNFGASLYHSLTGRAGPVVLPQEGSIQLPGHHLPDPPEQHNPSVPPLLSRLVMDCIQLEPTNRPADMQEVISRLGIVLRKEIQATPRPSAQPAS
jgi:eukaryotic-like serine/threonine-protein kinase